MNVPGISVSLFVLPGLTLNLMYFTCVVYVIAPLATSAHQFEIRVAIWHGNR